MCIDVISLLSIEKICVSMADLKDDTINVGVEKVDHYL